MAEIAEPNIPAVPSKSFEYLCAEYSFMVVPTESYSSESSEFFAMIQHVISNASFSGCLEFVSESNIPPSAWSPRYPICILFLLLGIMPRMPTALHLPVAHINDIIRSIHI